MGCHTVPLQGDKPAARAYTFMYGAKQRSLPALNAEPIAGDEFARCRQGRSEPVGADAKAPARHCILAATCGEPASRPVARVAVQPEDPRRGAFRLLRASH